MYDEATFIEYLGIIQLTQQIYSVDWIVSWNVGMPYVDKQFSLKLGPSLFLYHSCYSKIKYIMAKLTPEDWTIKLYKQHKTIWK